MNQELLHDSYQQQIASHLLDTALEASRYNLIALLKPRISIDGNMWCILWGENPQDGVCGFGESPYLAVIDFNKSWNEKLPKNKAPKKRRKITEKDARNWESS